ncbi:MAG: PHP domain-containing protein [Candidatus Marinimicrobia bacterium]|nr:PHP domain-containing protein [Candidatus Neomarinimicrobiota bacterium]
MNSEIEYVGCIHIHTIYSDGSGNYEDIISKGIEANLDYLMFSDHMTLQPKRDGYGGWYNGLFVIVGYEINDKDDRHHFLAFGIDEELPKDLSHEEYIERVKALGGLGIVAHPFEERDIEHALPGYPPAPWGNLDYKGIETIEIWNMMSHWMEKTTIRNKYWNAIHPRSFSTFPKKNLLQWWDNVNKVRKVTGIGSVDAHAIKVKVLGLFSKSIFDYKIMFKSIRTHLLLDKPISKEKSIKENEKLIFNAIKNGRCFISNYRRGDARGFRFWAENEGNIYHMGDRVISNDVTLKAILPDKAVCKVIKDGKVFYKNEINTLNLDVPSGIYRLEVEKEGRGWIYTNHIKVIGNFER